MYCMQTDTRYTEKLGNAVREYVLLNGEEAFLPMTQFRKKIHGENKYVLRPSFPGYIFINSDSGTDLFERLRNAWGNTIFKYTQLIRNNEYIIPLSEHDEDLITGLSDNDHVIKVSKCTVENNRLKILEGPLIDHEGEIVSVDKHKRTAVIEEEFMGVTCRIRVGIDY